MMDWNGDGSWPNSSAGYVLMILGMVIFWGLVIAAIAILVRQPSRRDRITSGLGHAERTPPQVLAERFAAGEIDEREFTSRMAALRSQQLP